MSAPEPAAPEPAGPADGDVLTAAVDLARAAAVEVAGAPDEVGEHLGASREAASAELGEVLTHTFAAALPGYTGWHWAVTVARVPGDEHVTVDEVVLLPGDSALLAPAWVPWHERIRPGDLSVGDVLPVTEDDPRLVPAYLADDDAAADPAGMVVAQEVGIGRERVLSAEGRREALARWRSGDRGPTAAIARHAPGSCGDCAFLMPLAGSVRLELGVCANEFAPADGHVVTTDHGCGAHSEANLVTADTTEIQLTPLYNTDTYDSI
ncbi:DUF3027 domain-containing protein [Klenkia sp. LSe6-5]|uniref:DUF3027 domain-containing protein n=1 Tax=Klenkia sesuvii TaxID=3103137 RepID=A0ABU8DYB3_9ACTN